MKTKSNSAWHRSMRLTGLALACLLCATACVQQRACAQSAAKQTHLSWTDYGGSADASQYSALNQINRSNVSRLKIAWKYPTADGKEYLFNPLVVDGVMYVLAKEHSIAALDAATGKELWVHPTNVQGTLFPLRGINYWESADRSDRRLLFAINNLLQEIDARTGKSISQFGKDGVVDLRYGLGRDPQSLTLVQSTTPGRVYGNLIILGSATNEEYDSGPGDIRAYDVLSGQLAWSFHTVPHPGEPGYETWPKDAWKTVGGANDWSGMSLDESRGILFVPTASPKYNFYGANRTGANLYGDCLLAINAQTGKLIWYFQMVHHDIWDYDNATPPQLLTVRHDGKMVDVVAQVGKEGFVWVFDRETGKPLWPIEERPVPHSDMPGEETWPTQPFPLKPPPFARQTFTAKDINPYMPADERAHLLEEMQGARNQGIFTPPATQNTVEMPGNNGGANFGAAASIPSQGLLYVVSKDLPAMLKLVLDEPLQTSTTGSAEERGRAAYIANCSLCHGADLKGQPPAIPSLVDIGAQHKQEEVRAIVKQGKGPMPAFARLPDATLDSLLAYLFHPAGAPASAEAENHTAMTAPADARYRSGFGFMFTEDGLPAIKPPWTTLTAYDLNSGTMQWQIPLGEVPELAAKGIKNTGSHFAKTAPVVTAGGLIFTGTRDRKVRAFDSHTGKLIWEFTLDAAVEGMPAVYKVNGREYVAFCAAAQATTHTHDAPGHPAFRAPIPGAYVAFALPEGSQ